MNLTTTGNEVGRKGNATSEEQPGGYELEERPFHLFRPSKDHTRLELVYETVQLLRKITKPICIITVVGNQRGGKSTLLNLLHSRKTSGFGLGHFMDPQTTGLWIWARPHPKNPDVELVLMDTEGLDSPHIQQWYNWTLSAVALLISAYFIYQTKGSIDSSATDRLGVILKVSEQLRGSLDPSTDKPSFLWLIRDHQLQMKQAPRKEMTDKLDPAALRALEKYFSDYDCVPLPRPVDRDELLKEVDKLGWEELRSDFREEYVVLERQIFNAVQQARKLSGRATSGDILASLIIKYAEAVSSKDGIVSELSQLPTQHQMIIKMAGERATKAALAEYEKHVSRTKQLLPVTEDVLTLAHKEAYEAAMKEFNREALVNDSEGIDKDLVEFIKELNDKIAQWSPVTTMIDNEYAKVEKLVGGIYYNLVKQNLDLSKEACRKELNKLYARIEEKLEKPSEHYIDIQQFHQDLEQLKAHYQDSDQAKGVAKEFMLKQFLEERRQKDGEKLNLALLKHQFFKSLEAQNKLISQLQEQIKQQETAWKEAIQTSQETSTSIQTLVNENSATILRLQQSFDSESKSTLEKLSSVQESIHKLEVPVALNGQSISTLQSRLEELHKQDGEKIRELNSKLESFESSNIQKFSQQESTLKQFDSRINQAVEFSSKLESSLNQVSQDLKTLGQQHKESLDTTHQTVLQLENSLQSLQTSHQALSSNLQQINQDLTNSLSTLKQDHSLSKQQVSQLQEDIKTIHHQVDQSSQSTLETLNNSLLQMKESLQGSAKQTEETLANLKSHTESQISTLQKQVESQVQSSVTTTLGQLQNRFSQLEIEFHQTVESEKQLTELVAQLSQRITSLQKAQENLLPKTSLAELQKTIDNLRSTFESMWASLGMLSSRIVDLEAKEDEKK